MLLLAGPEPGRVRERGLAASYSLIHYLIHSNSHSLSISCWELRTPSQKTESRLGGSSSGEDSKINKHLSAAPAHIRVWLSSGSCGPAQLASGTLASHLPSAWTGTMRTVSLSL